MAKIGKKYQEAAKLIDAAKLYSPKEAMELVKKTSVTKFNSSVEVAVRLGVNPKYADQQVRGALVLPHGAFLHQDGAAPDNIQLLCLIFI